MCSYCWGGSGEDAGNNPQGMHLWVCGSHDSVFTLIMCCYYSVAYLLGRKLRYSLTLKQVAVSHMTYEVVWCGVVWCVYVCMWLCQITTATNVFIITQRISGVAYDKIGQAVLRLKAIYKELQDDEEDQVCVCLPPRLSITSGMWRDMNSIQLVKQVLQLLYGNCSHYR